LKVQGILHAGGEKPKVAREERVLEMLFLREKFAAGID
jgi:hypothetical protein